MSRVWIGSDNTATTEWNRELASHLLRRTLFGVKKNAFGLIPGRVTYVVDKEGEIIFMYDSQLKAAKHIEESIKAIDAAIN